MVSNAAVADVVKTHQQIDHRRFAAAGRADNGHALPRASTTNPATRFVNSLVYTGVGLTGALSAISGGISVGQLSCFLSYANQYTKPFNEISGVVTELQNALACAARIFELIAEEPQLPEAADAVVLEAADGTVSLQNVAFSYTPF